MTQEEISKKLLEIRKKKGLSQYNIWKKGMNFGTVIAIESGKNVNLNNFLKYCDIVGIDITLKEKERIDSTFSCKKKEYINNYKNRNNMNNSEQQICIGKTTDSFEMLKKLCEEKAKSLSLTLDFSSGSVKSVSFWTSDFPELICIGNFFRGKDGNIHYDLDFSQSTL